MAEPDEPSMRASDADREATAERLRVAVEEGRLTVAEYDERLQAAYSAVSVAELTPLTADLPAPAPPEPAKPAEVRRRGRSMAHAWRGWASTSLMLIGIWAVISIASGHVIFFWPMFPVGIWGVSLLAGTLFGHHSHSDGNTEQ